jgi:hypothetical protein
MQLKQSHFQRRRSALGQDLETLLAKGLRELERS